VSGAQLEALTEQLATIVSANAALAGYHEGRLATLRRPPSGSAAA
jgi:hypothetical protein